MGTGKTTVGRCLAEELGLRFIDLDQTLAERLGKPIGQIFADHGEPFFRQLESDLIAEFSVMRGLVIATGGGAVLNPKNLCLLASAGPVICLTAALPEIIKRLAGSGTRPLLAAANPAELSDKIKTLLVERAEVYAAIPWKIATDGLTPAEIAQKILQQLPLKRLPKEQDAG